MLKTLGFPSIINLNSAYEMRRGSNELKVTCDVDGTTITWFKDMVIMSQSSQLMINSTNNGKSSIVSISPATLANNGAYTCVASNDISSVNSTIFVHGKLAFGSKQVVRNYHY